MGRRNRAQARARRLDKALSPTTLQFTGAAPRGLQPRQFGLMDAINTATARLTASGMAGVFEPLPRDRLDTTAFGPLNPLSPDPIDPVRRDTHRPEPRVFEYQNGWNLPGAGGRETPWQVLRAAADGVSLIRTCLEVRKRHVRKLKWEIAPAQDAVAEAYRTDPKKSRDGIEAEMRDRLLPEINRLGEFWKKPWHSNDWRLGQWINAVMEELLVLDAVPVYPRMSYSGAVLDLEVIDGTTIKPLLDWRGARPQPPYAAFQQILYGFPRGEWTASTTRDDEGREIVDNGFAAGELFYYRENVRAFTPYGQPPVERALQDSRIWLKRFGWMLAEYDDGSTPLTFLETAEPADGSRMDVTQRRLYEDAINDELMGQIRRRHRMKVLPNGWSPHQMTTAPERYRPEYDMFIIKLVAAHFGVPIAELGFTDAGAGLGAAGWHEGQAEVSGRVGLRPDVEVLSDLVNSINREFLRMPPELEFRFVDPSSQNDKDSDGVADAQVKSGRITLNDDRRRLGLALYSFPEADKPMIVTATGPVFLEGSFARAEEAAEAAKQQQLATAEGTRGKLELEGAKLEDGQKAREETREFERERMDRAEATEAQKMAELGAFRTWRRRNPEPRRPFLFKAVTPDDGFPELDGLTPDVVTFGDDWEWIIDDLEKGAMTWLEWNALHPNKPRGPNGRWVKRGDNLPDALRREGERTSRLLPDVQSSNIRGVKKPEPFERGQKLFHRNRGQVTYEGADDEGMSWVAFSDGTGGHVSTHLLTPDWRTAVPTEDRGRLVGQLPRNRPVPPPADEAGERAGREVLAELVPLGEWLRLPAMRDRLAQRGFDLEQQDAILHRLALQSDITISPVANLKSLTREEHLAAIRLGGEWKHAIMNEPPDPPKAAPDARRAVLAGMKMPQLRAEAHAMNIKTGGMSKQAIVEELLLFRWPRRTTKAAIPDDFESGAPDMEGNTDPKAEAPIPPDQRWPGWDVDEAIAAAVVPMLMAAVAAGVGVGALMTAFITWARGLGYRPGDPVPDVRSWLVTGTDVKDRLTEELIEPVRQAHVEGWMVGQHSADALMDWVREHEETARNAVEISINWGDWEPGHPEAAQLLIEPGGLGRLLVQSNVMIKTIAEHRLDEIGKILGRGLQRGDSPEAIAKELDKLVNNLTWAKMTALTETNRAMSAASVESYRRGGCWGKGWMTAYDQRVCATCKENEEMPDGTPRVVPIDGLFPSGDPWPPGHPRCRCAPIPVFELTRGF